MPQVQEFAGPTVSNTAALPGTGENPLKDYFANKPVKELMADLKIREKNTWIARVERGLPNLWRLIYAQAFGMDPSTGRNATQKLEFVGPQKDYMRFRVNLARAHIKQRNQVAQGQRVAYQCVASNDNAASLAQVPIASKALTYTFRASNGERQLYKALESDGYFGEGWVWERWDPDGGDSEKFSVDVPAKDATTGEQLFDAPGQPTMKSVTKTKRVGAPSYTCVYPWNAITEPNTVEPGWILIRERVSKYELMARFPEKAALIKGLTLSRESEPGLSELFQWNMKTATDDILAVKHWYHENCAAVPGGRYVGFVEDVDLWDSPCPMPEGLPLGRVCSAEYFDTGMGYPESCDLLSLQEAIDEMLSQSLTNIMRFGNQNLWGEDGVEFDQKAFLEGGKYFTLKTGQKPPAAIQWAELPEAVKYLLEYCLNRMADISGMNDTVRGNPPANITSGVFASLMQSIAEKFVNATQASYDDCVNRIGNITLELIRANTDSRFAAEVAGEANVPYMRYFTSQDFDSIKSVTVQRQSPLFNNIGGRFEVFDKTVNLPALQRKAAVQMLATGDSSAWTEFDMSTLILIRKENELLSKGIACEVSKTDDYREHVPSHRASLDRLRTQDVPTDPAEKAAWQNAIEMHVQHIGEHAVVHAQVDPVFADVCGLPPPPLPVMQPDGTSKLHPHPNNPVQPPLSHQGGGAPPPRPQQSGGPPSPPQLPAAGNPQSAAGRQPAAAPASNPGMPKSPNQQPQNGQGPAA